MTYDNLPTRRVSFWLSEKPLIVAVMQGKDQTQLRTGFTTGACATAASAAACRALLSGSVMESVLIRLPRGQCVEFNIEKLRHTEGSCQAAVRKDAGDDPDVTHNALILAEVRRLPMGCGIEFKAGEGVGTVTMPGLPLAVGEPAINPMPRRMITEAVREVADEFDVSEDFEVTISVPGGAEIAKQTWNPRLGIIGGISILGTTGIVRPYSCSAWIASIHRGVDVARAAGAQHVVGSTGSQSEAAAQRLYGLPDWAMLDMGDFVGGLLKYLRRHTIPRVTIAGGFGKITKLSQGALDLHSARSQVNFEKLAQLAETTLGDSQVGKKVSNANTAAHALEIAGPKLAHAVAANALAKVENTLGALPIASEVLIFSRSGELVGRSGGFQDGFG